MTAIAKAVSKLARAALAYAENGWHVFPLQVREKKPLIKGGKGFSDATTDIADVSAWWSGQPNANVGLWPGPSGLVVIDVDGNEGRAAALKLGAFAEPTLECSTGRADGGRHLYFRHPGFAVGNNDLAPSLEVRADMGYVVLPPSVHPTGKVYSWAGRVEDIREMPPTLLEALRKVQDTPAAGTAAHGSARDVAFESEIAQGGRNKALTRYAGRLFAKGIGEAEGLQLLRAMNAAYCKPPLPDEEIQTIVGSIAGREARKRASNPLPRNDGPPQHEPPARTADTGATLVLVDDSHEPSPTDEPTLAEIRAAQGARARALLTRDVSKAPRWAFSDLDALTGAMMPGEFVVVGAQTGNGKSALLMSQMDAFAERRISTLYVPLEIDADVNRMRWAAWRLSLNVVHVIRQEWERLPEGSHEAVDNLIDELTRNPFINFAEPKRINIPELVKCCRQAKDETGCRVVMLDHLHRMEAGGDVANYRINVTEMVRRLKDVARELELVMIASAQLNKLPDPIDSYVAPQLGRFKETGGIGEEADVALMLSRQLRRDLPAKWQQSLRLRTLTERDIEEHGIMVVTCRKHRLDNEAFNRSVRLQVVNGRVQNRARSWEQAPRDRQLVEEL